MQHVDSWPPKHDVLGTPISLASISEILPLLERRYPARSVVINVCNVHSVMSARSDRELAAAFSEAEINTADGMPLVWFLRSEGHRDQARVRGADLAVAAFEYGCSRGWRHFFYGSTPATLGALTARLRERFPNIVIVGAVSPPFPPTPADADDAVRTITSVRADIVWVGLGMPKQEKWMHAIRSRLPSTVLVGIGAAFDFLGGFKREAPQFIQQAGLEWLFRLGGEPRRLWRRYAWNNPAFLALWLEHVATHR